MRTRTFVSACIVSLVSLLIEPTSSLGGLILPRQGGIIADLDPITGSIRTIATVPSSFAFTDGFTVDATRGIAYYLGFSTGNLFKIDLTSGAVATVPVAGSVFSGSGGFGTDASGRLIFPRQGGIIAALDPVTGSITTIATVPSNFAFTDGFTVDAVRGIAYYLGFNTGNLYRIDLTSGAVATVPVAGSVFSGSGGFGTDASGRLIFPRQGGIIAALDPGTGSVTTIATVPSSFAFTDGFAVDAVSGTAYYVGTSGSVFSINISSGNVATLPVSNSVFSGSGGFGVFNPVPEPMTGVWGFGLAFVILCRSPKRHCIC